MSQRFPLQALAVGFRAGALAVPLFQQGMILIRNYPGLWWVVQAPTVLRMVPKGLAPVRRAVSTTVRTAASPSAAHIAR